MRVNSTQKDLGPTCDGDIMTFDLRPATSELAALVATVSDDHRPGGATTGRAARG
jgi:hypothetical protein